MDNGPFLDDWPSRKHSNFSDFKLPSRVSYWWIYHIYQSWWPTRRCMDLIVEHLNPVLGNCTTNLLSVYQILPIHFHYQSHRTIKRKHKVIFHPSVGGYSRPQMITQHPSTKKCLVGYHSNPFLAKHLQLIFTAESTFDINILLQALKTRSTRIQKSCLTNLHLNTHIYI